MRLKGLLLRTLRLEDLLLRTLPRYSLAPYAPGGPVVAAPAGQTAAYRDGATGQVFVRQPVNIIAIDIILDILILVNIIVLYGLAG